MFFKLILNWTVRLKHRKSTIQRNKKKIISALAQIVFDK